MNCKQNECSAQMRTIKVVVSSSIYPEVSTPHWTHLFIYLFETGYRSEELSQIGMSVEEILE